MAKAILVALTVLVSGCVSGLLEESAVTTRTITCGALSPDVSFHVRAHGGPEGALSAWVGHMSAVTGKPISMDRLAAPTADLLADWVGERDTLRRTSVMLHVAFVPALDAPGRAVALLAPGVVAISETAVEAAAEPDLVRQALVFHGLGHALGVVNAGIPLATVDVAGREDPQHHEPSVRSVMSAAWHQQASFPDTNATYDRYSEALIGDWRRALQPGGACE